MSSSSSETSELLSRFDPRRLLRFGKFTRKMLRRPSEVPSNSERVCESNLDNIISYDDFGLSLPTPLDDGHDKHTPTCDLCRNKQRQQRDHSLESTDSANSSDYHTAPLPSDDAEIPLETRDSIECLLETLQTQHGGKVPRWARRAARIVSQRDANDAQWSLRNEGNGLKRLPRLKHETTAALGQAPLRVRVVNKGGKVALLLRRFEQWRADKKSS
uniref:Uncharacterized protein n=1 Tax=Plectus sambesii TaxID=2011161 RepID=A0A914XUE1_9BILA